MIYITMRLFIYPSGEVPLYRQIMRQIVEAIAVGKLGPGDKLLSHRELAGSACLPVVVRRACAGSGHAALKGMRENCRSTVSRLTGLASGGFALRADMNLSS